MKISNKRWMLFSLIFSLIAVAVHAYLAKHHYDLEFGLGDGPSMCNVNDHFNCDAVSTSKYATQFGVPLAVWGACANTILAVLTFISWIGWTDDEEATGRYAFGLSFLIFLASIAMASISMLYMKTYCLFCMTAYVLSILQFAALWKGLEESPWPHAVSDFKEMFQSKKWILGMMIVIPAGAFFVDASTLSSSGLDKVKEQAEANVAQWKGNIALPFLSDKGLVIEARAPVKMTVVEFADFLCPHCKHASPGLNAFVKSHPDVRFVFKTFPLDSGCNPVLQGPPGDGARCELAKIVLCSEKLSHTGWAAHDYIFENQEDLYRQGQSGKTLEAFCAGQKVADCAGLKTCVDSTATLDEVKDIAKEGPFVTGTPTVLVNGKRLDNGQILPILEHAYRSLE